MLKEILIKSVKWKVWTWCVPSLGGLVLILMFGSNYFNLDIKTSILLGVISLITLWLFRFLYLLCEALIKYCHNTFIDSIWGDAIVELKNAYSEIHSLRKQEDISDTEFITVMVKLCDTLKKIFDKKTKANCCVSIKVPISSGDNLETLELYNLCRDSSHKSKSRDTEVYKQIKHSIIGNTAYSIIVNKILRGNQKHLAYVNNNIAESSDYENTSKEAYQDGIFPYNSELVYPIVPIKGNETNHRALKGFICIDCNKSNKFDENRYDIPLVQGVADGIYDIFTKRNND
jgi:hypothetical protein